MKSKKPPTGPKCTSTVSTMTCALSGEHAVHCSSERRLGQYMTWELVGDVIQVTTYQGKKKTGGWPEPAPPAVVAHKPLTLDDEPEDEEVDVAAFAALEEQDEDDFDDHREPEIEPCGAPRVGVPGGCQLFEHHDGEHFACVAGHAMAWRSGAEVNAWEICGSKWSRDKKVTCQRPEEHDGPHRGLDHIGNHMTEWEEGEDGGVHLPKTKIDLVAQVLGHKERDDAARAARKKLGMEPSLADSCPKCGREIGEHDGKKCPKAPKVTKRSDGALTAGPPTDGRSVAEHLDELAAPLEKIGEHEVHPIATKFRMIGQISAKDWAAFLEDIRVNRQRKRIVRVKVGSKRLILDGRNRLRACLDLGIEPLFRDFGSESGDGTDPIAFVLSENVHRRHEDETSRAFLGAELVPMYEAQARERMVAGKANPTPNSAEGDGGEAVEQAAKAVNVGKTSVKAALTVMRDGAPEVLAAARDRGQIKVSTAADLSKLPKQRQREIVEKIGGGELRSGKVRALVNQEKKRAVVRKINEGRVAPMPLGPFGVIYGDYPWHYENSDQHEGSRGHLGYATMKMVDVLAHATDTARRAAKDCIVALWSTNLYVTRMEQVLDAYGATVRTVFTWPKPKFGVGTWGRGQTEHLVIASIGSPVHTLNEVSTLLQPFRPARPGEHSSKPNEVAELLAKHCGGPFLELFARDQREGWTCWGAEVDKFAKDAA